MRWCKPCRTNTQKHKLKNGKSLTHTSAECVRTHTNPECVLNSFELSSENAVQTFGINIRVYCAWSAFQAGLKKSGWQSQPPLMLCYNDMMIPDDPCLDSSRLTCSGQSNLQFAISCKSKPIQKSRNRTNELANPNGLVCQKIRLWCRKHDKTPGRRINKNYYICKISSPFRIASRTKFR